MTTVPREGEEAPSPGPHPSGGRREDRHRRSPHEEEALLFQLGPSPRVWSLGERLWAMDVRPDRWVAAATMVVQTLDHPLSTLFAEDATDRRLGVVVHALFLGTDPTPGVHLRCSLGASSLQLPTLSGTIPYVTPFEREVTEMFGVQFAGAVDVRPLLLHASHSTPPLRKGPPPPPSDTRSAYRFSEVEGEGVYEVPVGPVHAGVIEPGHFRFQVVGEKILDLETRFGYTHKGTERLFEGLPVDRGTILAESISGDMSVAGAVAYAHAVERALELSVPSEIEDLRGLLLEVERAAFLCGDVAGIALDVGYAVGAAQANVQRESAYGIMQSLTGARLGRSVVGVGGLRRPLVNTPDEVVRSLLAGISSGIQELHDHLLDKSSVVDRLQGTGVVPREVADLLHFLGPTARASGLRVDLRVDRPYGPYVGREVRVPRGLEGDVASRLNIKVQEIIEACRLASEFATTLRRGGEHRITVPSPTSFALPGLGWVESPRGEFLVYVQLGEDGKLQRVHVRDPSFLTWPAIEHAVRGNIVPDFPLCNKSLNLSYSGYDR